MGERCKDALRVNFERKLKVEFHKTKLTGDTSLLTYREIDPNNIYYLNFREVINGLRRKTGTCRYC